MTNLEKWRYYLKDFTSPDSYINWGWYYTVAAALQRRVWIGATEKPIFPNLYVVFVCRAGVGKSLVIDTVEDYLKHFPLTVKAQKVNGEIKNSEKEDPNVVTAEILDAVRTMSGGNVKEVPPLFPIAANSTTYEALVRAIATSTRFVEYPAIDPKRGLIKKSYGHCSICFVLSELGSLMRKNTEDIVSLIQQTYDCKDYTYDTKTQGKDTIRKCCVSILAGATPDFMQRVFTDELLSEGISSRTIFVFETKNRFDKCFIHDFTPEQLEYKKQLLAHIKNLSALYGKVELEPGLLEYVEDWWQTEAAGRTRSNRSSSLDHYYARKNLHTLKTAMAIHFSDNLSLTLTRSDVDAAIKLLAKTELTMHNAVILDNRNPLMVVMKKMVNYITRYGPQTKNDLVIEFIGSIETGLNGMKELLELAVGIGKLEYTKCEDGVYRYAIAKEQHEQDIGK